MSGEILMLAGTHSAIKSSILENPRYCSIFN
jgi:hypothetical protein